MRPVGFLTSSVMRNLPTEPHPEDQKNDTQEKAPSPEPIPLPESLDPRHAQQLAEFLARQRRAMGFT